MTCCRFTWCIFTYCLVYFYLLFFCWNHSEIIKESRMLRSLNDKDPALDRSAYLAECRDKLRLARESIHKVKCSVCIYVYMFIYIRMYVYTYINRLRLARDSIHKVKCSVCIYVYILIYIHDMYTHILINCGLLVSLYIK